MDLVGADGGLIGRYRKMHIPGSEQAQAGVTTHLERRYFEPGNLGFPVYAYRGVRIGLALCNDRRWPETIGCLPEGAQVVLIGYNTPTTLEEAPALAHLRMFHNHLPMQAGAYQNTLWVAACEGGTGGRSGLARRVLHHCSHRRDRGAGSVGGG